ncbi:nuclear receptor coactivator 7-like isoform X3 [Apostichopus japonicus]|uniref:nuclear receptor coactivator 7-like isoform X3 n=1 Tax=Stichopus japonicus TaxID=307972 RepID=UPI003AB68593
MLKLKENRAVKHCAVKYDVKSGKLIVDTLPVNLATEKLYVPDPNSTEPVVLSPTSKSFPSETQNSFSSAASRVDIPAISVSPKVPDVPVVKPADRPKKNRLFMRSKSKDDETGGTRERRQKYRKKHVKKQNSTPIPGRVIRQNTHDSDNDENSKQFLKLDVKYITDGEGVVSGTMLVTPNAIMFDPNVSDPLVIDRGVGSYGVITQMDIVVGASMYHDISAMSLKVQAGSSSSSTCPVYIPGEQKNGLPEEKPKEGATASSPTNENGGTTMQDDENHNKEYEKQAASSEKEDSSHNGENNSKYSPQNTSVEEEGEAGRHLLTDGVGCCDDEGSERNKDNLSERLSDNETEAGASQPPDSSAPSEKFPNDVEMHDGSGDSNENVQSKPEESSNEMDNRDDERIETEEEDEEEHEEGERGASDSEEQQQEGSSEDKEEGGNRKTDEMSNLAKVVAETDEGVTPEKQDSEIPEKQLDLSRKSLAEETGESNQAFVNFSSGLFVTDKRKCSMVADMSECVVDNGTTEKALQEIQEDAKELRRLSEEEVMKERSWVEEKLASENLRKDGSSSSDETREKSSLGGVKLVYTTEDFEASSGAKKQIKSEFRPRPAQRYEDPPLYLCLKVYRPMQKTFVRPQPGEEGEEEEENNGSTKTLKTQKSEKLPEYWFAIPRDKADNLYNFFLQWSPEKYGKEVSPDDLGFVPVEQTEPLVEVVEDFFNEPISKDWEIVSKEEANRRRMTLLECEMDLPLPQLLGESRLLDATHISKLRKELPPRTEGYNWAMIYNTASDGFSLQSLYRTMQDWECPVLLLLEDSSNNLFGALVSCPLKESEAYYGTGESFLFQFEPGEDVTDLVCYRWTGENMYFIKGDKDSISIGGGEGTIGLWLDGDLYHGRCRKCKTFDNTILSGTEDFVIKNLEVWGFVM